MQILKKLGVVVVASTALALLLAYAPRAIGAGSEESAVRDRVADFVTTWQKHDPKALAAFWAEDGDLINPWGRLAEGRAAVENLFKDEHDKASGPLRECTLGVGAGKVRFPSPDVAIFDADGTMTGVYDAKGAKLPVQSFHATFVWKQADGQWLVYAARPYMKPVANAPSGAEPVSNK